MKKMIAFRATNKPTKTSLKKSRNLYIIMDVLKDLRMEYDGTTIEKFEGLINSDKRSNILKKKTEAIKYMAQDPQFRQKLKDFLFNNKVKQVKTTNEYIKEIVQDIHGTILKEENIEEIKEFLLEAYIQDIHNATTFTHDFFTYQKIASLVQKNQYIRLSLASLTIHTVTDEMW